MKLKKSLFCWNIINFLLTLRSNWLCQFVKYYKKALCFLLVREKPRKLQLKSKRWQTVSAYSRYTWGCFSHICSKGFPSTFSLRRGIQFHAFLIFMSQGAGRPKKFQIKYEEILSCNDACKLCVFTCNGS